MKKVLLICVVIFTLSACEEVLFEDYQSSTLPFENFAYLWQKCDEQYSYFEVKQVDWDSVKLAYQDKLYQSMSQDSLFNVLSAMLNELKDDHVNLVSGFRTSFYGNRFNAQDNFDWRIIVDNYISSNYELTGPFQHNFIENDLAYVRLNSFTEDITSTHLDYILTKYQSENGLILDLRENGGGKIAKAYELFERFIDEEQTVAYTRIKNGLEYNAFSAPRPVSVKPHDGVRFTKPLFVLIDRGSFSSTSIFALATKAFPHIKLIGQQTGGGLGMPNGGQLPNGWRYRFSVTQTLDLEQSPMSENGVLPDIEMSFNWDELTTDEILEIAINQL